MVDAARPHLQQYHLFQDPLIGRVSAGRLWIRSVVWKLRLSPAKTELSLQKSVPLISILISCRANRIASSENELHVLPNNKGERLRRIASAKA